MTPALGPLLALLQPAPSPPIWWAFSDPTLFGEPAEHGGGGGRYFTGSPADGLGCTVCHRGGEAPRVTIDGLPSSFVPGSRYTVSLRWEDSDDSHALQLELSEPQGRHADVEIVAEDELAADMRCEGSADGAAAVYTVDVGDRRIVGVQDCGAAALTFTFTAPDVPELVFAAGIVRSDSSATVEGDGALDLRETLTRAGDEASGCSLGERGELGWLVVLAALARRRRQRNSAPNNAVTSTACTRCNPTKAR